MTIKPEFTLSDVEDFVDSLVSGIYHLLEKQRLFLKELPDKSFADSVRLTQIELYKLKGNLLRKLNQKHD